MDTMSGTADDKDDKVDVFGGNKAATLGASIFLAVILLIGTIGLPDGGGGKAPQAPQVAPLTCNAFNGDLENGVQPVAFSQWHSAC